MVEARPYALIAQNYAREVVAKKIPACRSIRLQCQRFLDELKVEPAVCFVKVTGATGQLEDECKKAGIAADAYQFDGDYYALPNLVPLLARPSKRELLQEILEYPLPERRAA